MLLCNIRDATQTLTLLCNAGKAIVIMNGDLKVYGTVWHHPAGIADILSLNNAQKKDKVTYDSSLKGDGTNHVFLPSKKSLFFSYVKKH